MCTGKIKNSILALLGLVFFVPQLSFAQNNESNRLKIKRQKLENEIKYTNKLLTGVAKNKKSTLYELQLLDSRINKRDELIATLKREIYLLDEKIAQSDNTLKKLSDDIKALKKEYAQIAYYLYRNNSAFNKLIFLFSADDLNQAYQRLRYMEEMSAFVRKQAEELKKKEKKQAFQLKKFTGEKKAKKRLLNKQSDEMARLELEQKRKNQIRKQLAGKERKLRARLHSKQRAARKLTRQIETIIARETAPVKKKGKTVSYKLTPQEQRLSNSFVANKGKLPWPVDRGVISETFGVHNHPVLKHVKIKNNGVNIATAAGKNARSVFEGKVVSVMHITNTNIAVIIKHGAYFSVYSDLEKVYVKKNETVITKEAIGKIHTNLQGKTELHFEVWKGKVLQNPAYWLRGCCKIN